MELTSAKISVWRSTRTTICGRGRRTASTTAA